MGKEITLTLLEGLKKAQVCADSIFTLSQLVITLSYQQQTERVYL